MSAKSQEPSQPSPETPKQPKKLRQDSFGGDPSADPWASPAIRNIPPSTASHTMKPAVADDFTASAINGVRATNDFSQTEPQSTTIPERSVNTSATITGNAWGSYNSSNGGGFGDQTNIGDGFDASNDTAPVRAPQQQHRATTRSVAVPPGTGELVTVTTLPDKEGVFLFQHHNYEVKAIRRASSVVRRYSDFVWLLDCLQKRYPFRRLPLLPPKRIQGTLE